MAAEVDFRKIVNAAADRFEVESRMKVIEGARTLLVKRALPYQEKVEIELAGGKITIGFLENSLLEVFENARAIARELRKNYLDEFTVEQSMKNHCPYVMWC